VKDSLYAAPKNIDADLVGEKRVHEVSMTPSKASQNCHERLATGD